MTAENHHGFFSTAPIEAFKKLRSPVWDREIEQWDPKTSLGQVVRRALPLLPRDMALEMLSVIKRSVVMESSLSAVVYRGLGLWKQKLIPWNEVLIEDHGVVSLKVVTDAGVAFIVDAFQNSTEIETLKYHALGTGGTAESAAQTALVTELTTEYTGNVRATGTTSETSANIYSTVATNTLDSGTPAVTEHGIFSASSVGTMLDRSLFSAINLVGANGDGLTTTYLLTLAAGG